jgi:uncharacterized delta-60 repeat protein
MRRISFRPKVEMLESRTLLSAGDLDPTFGMGGKVTTTFQGPLDTPGEAAALQPDGKVVMAGSFYNFSSSGFALARYNADGSLDPAFGSGGTVTTPIGSTATTQMQAKLLIQGDGKIVVAGMDASSNFVLARYNGDGSLDSSFGSSGKVTGHINAAGIALEPDGKIIVVGITAGPDPAHPSFLLTRYNADGSLDTTFGSGGTVTSPFGTPSSITVQPDGRIIVAGYSPNTPQSNNAFVVARYNTNGSLDAGFGSGGEVTTKFASNTFDQAAAVVLQPDGKIVVGGTSTTVVTTLINAYALARYNSDGSLDPSFGSGGKVTSVPGGIASLALQSDGKIVAAGGMDNPTGSHFGFTMARFSSTGMLDTTFGAQGVVTGNFLNTTANVLVQGDGRIITAGAVFTVPGSTSDQRFALNRFTSSGSPDTSFGTGGKVVTTFIGPVLATPEVVLLQPDGKIVVAGFYGIGTQTFALTRYNPDGNLDATFGNGGKATLQVNTGAISAGVLQPDGKILVVGLASQANGPAGLALVRFNADGSLDQSFGSGGLVITTPGGLTNGRQVALQPDGKILVAAKGRSTTGSDTIGLVRFNTDGSLDTGFMANIPALLPMNTAADIPGLTLQSDGKIVLSAYALGLNNTNKYALLRFNPSGSLDPTFGNGGIAAIDFSGKVHVQPDGRIVVVGPNVAQGTDRAVALARFFPNGNPDTTFGTGGKAVANFGPNGGPPDDFTIQPNGKILASGRAAGNTLAVARFDPNGSPDSSFGMGSVATADLADKFGSVTSLALQPDGRIVEAGRALAGPVETFGLARFKGDSPISNANQVFVIHVYLDLLQRSPDPNGLTFWAGMLDQGMARTDVVARIEGSGEYRALVVQGMYGHLLGRAADPAGLNGWVNFLNQGNTAEQLQAAILGSDEYFSRHGGNNSSFLQALYIDVLQRAIDSSGAQTWGQALANGLSRNAVAAAVLASPESDGLEVASLYHQFLRRDPDSVGLQAFTDQLQHGVPNEMVLASIVGSGEYFSRWQQLP